MHQKAQKLVERELNPEIRYFIREAAKQIYMDPEAFTYSFYALSRQIKDEDSVKKALDVVLFLHGDSPLVDSDIDGDPIHERGEALRSLGLDISDDEIENNNTLFKLAKHIERKNGYGSKF